MKHLTKLFLTLFLIVTLVLGVLVYAASKTQPRKQQKSLVRTPKLHTTNQSAPNLPASGPRPLPVTPGVVVVDTTSPIRLFLDDLYWLFTQVHYAALGAGITLVFKTLYDVYEEEAKDKSIKMEILDRIKCVVKGVAVSLTIPKTHSKVLFSLLVNRFIPWKFTLESFLGLDKYINPATFKFARLVAPFYFSKYFFCVPVFIDEKKFSKPILTFIMSVFRWISYLLPVIAMVGAALGEVIFFVWSMVSGKKSGRGPGGRGYWQQ